MGFGLVPDVASAVYIHIPPGIVGPGLFSGRITEQAALGGLLGVAPDDLVVRIPQAFNIDAVNRTLGNMGAKDSKKALEEELFSGSLSDDDPEESTSDEDENETEQSWDENESSFTIMDILSDHS